MTEPKIRFKDKNGQDYPEWKDKKLSDLVEHYGGTALESLVTDNGSCKFISIGNYSPDGQYIDNGQRINPVGKAEDKRLNRNDLVMVLNDKTSAGTIIGSTIIADDDNYVYNQRSERMVCKNGVIPKYMWFYMNSCVTKKKILKLVQGGTQIYVNFASVYDLDMKLPCVGEQQAIAEFLSIVNDIIFTLSEEVRLWEEKKKGVMQKLFFREVRFKDENGEDYPEWEERFLGDFCDITTGKLDANAMVENGKYDFYTSGIAKYKINEYAFEGPAITVAGNGATVGYLHLADGKFNAYQRTYVLTNFKAVREYLYSVIGTKLPIKIRKEVRAGSIPYIVFNMLSELEIPVPCLEEQQKIADCLSSIDEVIAIKKQKLETWKTIKRGLLQQMFV